MTTASTLTGAVTQNLAPFFSERKGARISSNWLAFVGRGGGVTNFSNDVNEVVYEIMRGNRRTAKLVRRSNVVTRVLGSAQKNMEMGSYTRVARAFPLSVEEYDLQSSRLTEKVPNEPTTDSGWSREDRAMWWAAKGQTELLSRQNRMMNYLAGQGILEGLQDAIIGTSDTDLQYDFYRLAAHSKTLSIAWTTLATATPLVDLDTGISAVVDATGKAPQFALMGNLAYAAMLKTTEVQGFKTATGNGFEAFHRVGATNAVPSEFAFLTANGWEAKGFVQTWEGRILWIFGSEELLELTAGTSIRSMPSTKVVLGNTNSRLDAQFGPPETFPETASVLRDYQEWFGFQPGVTPSGEPDLVNGVLRPEMFHLDAYQNKERTLRTMRSQTAPLYIPVDTDSWYVIENAAE